MSPSATIAVISGLLGIVTGGASLAYILIRVGKWSQQIEDAEQLNLQRFASLQAQMELLVHRQVSDAINQHQITCATTQRANEASNV